MELDSCWQSPWPDNTTSSLCRWGKGMQELFRYKTEWRVMEGEGSTASVPLTAIQKGKSTAPSPRI